MTNLVKFPKENLREKLKVAAAILVKRESPLGKLPLHPYILPIVVIAAIAGYFILRSPAISDSYNVTIDQSSHVNNITTIVQPSDKPLRPWVELSTGEKEGVVAEAFIFFPEVVSRSEQGKYKRVSQWLQKERGIYHKNVRDIFTAGGRGELFIKGKIYEDVPRVLMVLHKSIPAIAALLPDKKKRLEWQESIKGKLDTEGQAIFQAITSSLMQ